MPLQFSQVPTTQMMPGYEPPSPIVMYLMLLPGNQSLLHSWAWSTTWFWLLSVCAVCQKNFVIIASGNDLAPVRHQATASAKPVGPQSTSNENAWGPVKCATAAVFRSDRILTDRQTINLGEPVKTLENQWNNCFTGPSVQWNLKSFRGVWSHYLNQWRFIGS